MSRVQIQQGCLHLLWIVHMLSLRLPHSLGDHQPIRWAYRCPEVFSVMTLHICHWFPISLGLSLFHTISSSRPSPMTMALPWALWSVHLAWLELALPHGHNLGPATLVLHSRESQEGHPDHYFGLGQFYSQHPITLPHIWFILKIRFTV